MTKVIKIQAGKENKENLTIQKLYGDRVLCLWIDVEPVKKSGIINPHTDKDFQDKTVHFDRYPYRARVIELGDGAKDKGLKKDDFVYLEDTNATTNVLINHEQYFLTRMSNIILSYSDNV